MAMDFSTGMLAKAQAKMGDLPGLTFSLADVTHRWPCADSSANLVTCNLILEHMPDLQPVFSEAARALVKDGWFFVSELHPFRQYEGALANFRRGERTIQISEFVHNISEFLNTAQHSGFTLKSLQEWWHGNDVGKPPRLVSFLFERSA
jgi:malonyl-CoA O-methyltransferase